MYLLSTFEELVMTMDESLFEKPAGEWTDDEIRVGLLLVTARRDEVAAAGDAALAGRLNDVLVVLAGERDRRTVLYGEAERAASPVKVTCPECAAAGVPCSCDQPGRLVGDTASERRRRRRGR